jgi:RNA polymerase sigma-70 factor, ECF subfamily
MMSPVALRQDSLVPSAPEALDPAETEAQERQREREWVEAAMAGDARAFRAIVERHHRGLFQLALRMVGRRTDAEDVVQDSFARAYRCLDRYDPEYRLSTWLYRIALNICRDHLKSPRRRERPDGLAAASYRNRTEEADRADVHLARARQVQRLRRALEQLSPSYREAVVLKDLEELTYHEMRRVTGTPITALKIRVVRARNKLRTLLEEEEGAA